MLTTYAEEAEGLERGRRQSAVEASLHHQRAVLSLVESVLKLQLLPPGTGRGSCPWNMFSQCSCYLLVRGGGMTFDQCLEGLHWSRGMDCLFERRPVAVSNRGIH